MLHEMYVLAPTDARVSEDNSLEARKLRARMVTELEAFIDVDSEHYGKTHPHFLQVLRPEESSGKTTWSGISGKLSDGLENLEKKYATLQDELSNMKENLANMKSDQSDANEDILRLLKEAMSTSKRTKE
jgi:septation ring formation regulator EzrA